MSQDSKKPKERPPLEKKAPVKEPSDKKPEKRLQDAPDSADLRPEEKQKLHETYGQSPDQVRRTEKEGYSSIEESLDQRASESRVNQSRNQL